MKNLQLYLSRYGWHAFLLPVFFVLHNYLQYYGLVEGKVAFRLFLILMGATAIFFLLLLKVTKNAGKSASLVTITIFILLFYGVIKDFIDKTLHLYMLSKYIVLMPVLFIIAVGLFIVTLRKRSFGKLNIYLNSLLVIFIIMDVFTLVTLRNHAYSGTSLMVKKNLLDTTRLEQPVSRPDVYFFIFDCYPGTKFLNTYMNFDNSLHDDALIKKGFKIVGNSSSNYNRTAFSLASELNFEYLKDIDTDTKIEAKHYNKALLAVNYSTVSQLFKHFGYQIINLSIFDIQNIHPVYKENFLTASPVSMLMYNTLFYRSEKDVFWNFANYKFFIFLADILGTKNGKVLPEGVVGKREFNQLVADSVIHTSSRGGTIPTFVYAHFYLPHPPFFFNEKGEANDPRIVLDEQSVFSSTFFISYLQYTNKVMEQLIDSVLDNSKTPPVIIIQGDHGFTNFRNCPDSHALRFKNYSAFYFPDRNYNGIYETMSNINTFPLIANKYFNTHILLQKDTSFFLSY